MTLIVSLSACGEAPATPTLTDTPSESSASPEPAAPDTVQPVIPVPGNPDDIVFQPIPLPYAVLVDTGDGLGLTVYDRVGLALDEYQLPAPLPATAHVGTGIADGINLAPLVFLGSDENGGSSLKASFGGQVIILFEIPRKMTVGNLIGVPGQPIIAFSSLEPLSEGAIIRSKLFVGNYESISLDTPVLVVDSSESRIILPVAIRMGSGALAGLWYTYRLWGIGGDMFTEPRNGLYYLDLATGISSEYLGMDQLFSSLSISQTVAAWTAASDSALSVTNLKTGDSVTFPALPESDRGAAHAFVSPSDSYVAWVEGKGWLYDGNLETTVRIATLDGISLGDYPASMFAKSSGLGTDILICPVGWLDDEVLLVAAYNQETREGALVRVNANTGELSPFRSGFFVGFASP